MALLLNSGMAFSSLLGCGWFVCLVSVARLVVRGVVVISFICVFIIILKGVHDWKRLMECLYIENGTLLQLMYHCVRIRLP